MDRDVLKIDYDTYVEQRLRKIEKQTQVARSENSEKRWRIHTELKRDLRESRFLI